MDDETRKAIEEITLAVNNNFGGTRALGATTAVQRVLAKSSDISPFDGISVGALLLAGHSRAVHIVMEMKDDYEDRLSEPDAQANIKNSIEIIELALPLLRKAVRPQP